MISGPPPVERVEPADRPLGRAGSAREPGRIASQASPAREWVTQAMASGERGPSSPTGTPAPAAVPAPRPVPAGVSISPAAGRTLVSLSSLQRTVVRLGPAAGAQASIAVLGAERDPVFRTEAGRVEVRDGLGGEVRVWLPLTVDGARLEVDGQLYADVVAGALRLHVPAEAVDGQFIWR